MKRISECKTPESGVKSKFFVKEMGKTFTLNSKTIFYCEIVLIDKCVFTDSELRRCDYLFLVPSKEMRNERFDESKAFFIELKGDDVRSACEQLFNAIDKTRNDILNYDIEAKVIGTKGFQPDLRNN